MGTIWILAVVLLLAGCGAVVMPEQSEAPGPAHGAAVVDQEVGRGGTLHHEQISISLALGKVGLRVTPLDEQVLRLTSPDVRRRLHSLALEGGTTEADRQTSFLVSFAASAPDQVVSPTALRFESGGRRLEISAIHPVTDGWGEQRLRVREPQAAVYVLRERIDPFTALRVAYGTVYSDAWREIIPLLRAEERRIATIGGALR